MSSLLALLHGWGSSPAVWNPMLAAITAPIDALALDLPGHGAGGDLPADLDAWADRVLDDLPPRSVLCGWSLGALLALRMAQRAPGRIERLILISATPCFVKREEWPAALDADDVSRFQQSFAEQPESLHKRFRALQALGDGRRREVLEALERTRASAHHASPAGMAAGLEILRRCDLRATLAEIAQPVRLLHGAGDALMPVGAAVALADALPDARLSVFEDCGHAPHLSRPIDCAALVEAFLDD